jgi:hypothetical protein
MKNYIAKIEEINGGMEYKTEFLFTTKKDSWAYGNKVAADWRSGNSDYDSNVGGYWNEETIIRLDTVHEVPPEDFEVLRKYLPVL